MSKKPLHIMLCLIALLATEVTCDACNQCPEVKIYPPRNPIWAHAQVPRPGGFDGSLSFDPDGVINDWLWSWSDGSPQACNHLDNGGPCGPPPSGISHTFVGIGTYYAALTLTDNGSPFSCTDCNSVTVHVVDVGISCATSFIQVNDDDDNDNGTEDLNDSGTVSGENDLAKITISMATASLGARQGCKLRLDVTGYYAPWVQIWTDQTKGTRLIGNGTYRHEWDAASLPSTWTDDVWIEGTGATDVNGVWVVISYIDTYGVPYYPPEDFLKFTVCDCSDCRDHQACIPVTKDGIRYTVGDPIDETRITGPSHDGRLVHLGSTIRFTAKEGLDRDCRIVGNYKEPVLDKLWIAWFDDTGRARSEAFPGGYHGWSTDTRQVDWKAPETPGTYTVTCEWSNVASDCYYDDETVPFSRTVEVVDFSSMTERPSDLSVQEYALGRFTHTSFTDDFGNRARVKFNDGNGCYEMFYKAADDTEETIVGRCIWDGGANLFLVDYTAAPLHGAELIVSTRHSSKNDSTSDGEGCPGFYCYICSEYDAFSETFVYKQWRGQGSHYDPEHGNFGEMWKDGAPECEAVPAAAHHTDLEF